MRRWIVLWSVLALALTLGACRKNQTPEPYDKKIDGPPNVVAVTPDPTIVADQVAISANVEEAKRALAPLPAATMPSTGPATAPATEPAIAPAPEPAAPAATEPAETVAPTQPATAPEDWTTQPAAQPAPETSTAPAATAEPAPAAPTPPQPATVTTYPYPPPTK